MYDTEIEKTLIAFIVISNCRYCRKRVISDEIQRIWSCLKWPIHGCILLIFGIAIQKWSSLICIQFRNYSNANLFWSNIPLYSFFLGEGSKAI